MELIELSFNLIPPTLHAAIPALCNQAWWKWETTPIVAYDSFASGMNRDPLSSQQIGPYWNIHCAILVDLVKDVKADLRAFRGVF